MKIFLACLFALIIWAILTQVFGVPAVVVFGGCLFAFVVGYVTG